MKVIHIESGLGNQMLSYCELLALKKENPGEDFYIDTITYDIPECNDVICQWNGYELERIFGIKANNIRQCLTDVQWQSLMDDIHQTQFWLHNWNWPVYFQRAFSKVGLNLNNVVGDFEAKGQTYKAIDINRKKTLKDFVRNKDIYLYLQRRKKQWSSQRLAKTISNENNHFYKSNDDELTGQRLTFKFVNSGIERIEKEIRETFVFPEILDAKNKECLEQIQSCNSVAIHARRGDMLGFNYPLYRFGYFKKCVRFIRARVDKPVFFIFCDPESVQWAKDNPRIFDLNFERDEVHFVDWNNGDDSFRDMQLMAQCKHQIITQSSFGWWGAWLNTNPDKITISPEAHINTTHHF